MPLSTAIFSIESDAEFEALALQVFQQQAVANPVYAQYLAHIGCSIKHIKQLKEIPFLPVELFKNHIVSCYPANEHAIVFSSSGTTNTQQSQHFVKNVGLYIESCRSGFAHFYGNIADYCVLALLPAYLERQGSSLVYMAADFIEHSKHHSSNFYLYDYQTLAVTLEALQRQKQKTLLLGVSFALWDFAEQFPMDLSGVCIMETGGMKGRRPEITRGALHQILKNAFKVSAIHSEYGMTEMLSQAYSQGEGVFRCPPWLRVLVRETNDPFSWTEEAQTGAICVIDLANWHSCSFLALSDLGKTYSDGSFEILGRMDYSDMRGCNLMVE
jgi:phenylacetate-coenzyme A ligase PaaK-like adenylate-forming protein